ncbi:MAG: hypothetical protein H8F28_06455, partial [Fibrella sp.]|nr:hypothetical protein [Armatimonadota bacterium]
MFHAKIKPRRVVIRTVPASEIPPTPTIPGAVIETDPATGKIAEVFYTRSETPADIARVARAASDYLRK